MDFQRDLLALAIYFIVLISVMIRFNKTNLVILHCGQAFFLSYIFV